jgi:hypothetical protein
MTAWQTPGRHSFDFYSLSSSGGVFLAGAFCADLSKVLHISKKPLHRFRKFMSTLSPAWYI